MQLSIGNRVPNGKEKKKKLRADIYGMKLMEEHTREMGPDFRIYIYWILKSSN